MPQEFEDDVQLALDEGKKVTAIKLLRQHRNLGLKEAKDLLDGHVAVQESSGGSAGSNKSIINSIILALVGFAVYKLFFES